MWWLLLVASMVAAVALWRVWRWWIVPWRDIDEVIDALGSGRQPRTFLIDGNPRARRAALKLEEVFLRQRAMQQRASAGELDVRAILDAMPDGLCVLDEAGRVRLLNPAARRMFSINNGADSGTGLETLRDATITRLLENALHHGSRAREAINVRGRDESVRDVTVTAVPITSESGITRGAVMLFEDVTQLQQLEGIRRDFVSNVSHELRTPLSIFRGYLETLLDEPGLPAEERGRILRVLEKHSARLTALADDLLSLARLEAPDPHLQLSKVNLPEFLHRVAKEWEKKAATRNVRIVVNADNNLRPLRADEARLEEVLYNLLDNALKYSTEGRQITVSAARQSDARISIRVADEGPGIAAADLPRIFERFYRTDKARSRDVGGTGLGLSIVKHIVQLHGGTVEAQSELGRGTTVSVRLPQDAAGAE